MEGLVSGATDAGVSAISLKLNNAGGVKALADQAALASLSTSANDDAAAVGIDFSDLYKSLTVEGKKIVDSLNDLLKKDLPNGIQSLKPADTTPEATADRIVSGATSSFAAFQKQHPEMSDEEVLSHYMDLVRKGVDEGYSDAFETLKGLGAFEYDGVQSGVEQTKKLINKKLDEFEKTMRQQLGIDAAAKEEVATAVTAGLTQQAGANILQIAA